MEKHLLAGSILIGLLVLCACGGGSSGPLPPPAPPTPVTLFTGDVGENAALIWRPEDGVSGNVTPDSTIGGPINTQFSSPYGVHYDARTDTLVVGDFNNDAIKFFDNVSALDGDVAPSRVLSGPITMIGGSNAYETYVDELRDLLYVSYSDGILVFNSAATISGGVGPARVITGPATGFSGNQDKRLFLDAAADRLYVLDGQAQSLMVYDNVSTVDGNTAPNRTLSGGNTNFNYPWGIAVDVGRDIVYVSDESNHAIYVFDGASTINGNIAPSRTISGPISTVVSPAGIDVDPLLDRLYVPHFPGGGSPGISVWDNASTVDGNVAPTRTIIGAATNLNSPQDLVVRR